MDLSTNGRERYDSLRIYSPVDAATGLQLDASVRYWDRLGFVRHAPLCSLSPDWPVRATMDLLVLAVRQGTSLTSSATTIGAGVPSGRLTTASPDALLRLSFVDTELPRCSGRDGIGLPVPTGSSGSKDPEWVCRRIPRALAGVDHYRVYWAFARRTGTPGRRHGGPVVADLYAGDNNPRMTPDPTCMTTSGGVLAAGLIIPGRAVGGSPWIISPASVSSLRSRTNAVHTDWGHLGVACAGIPLVPHLVSAGLWLQGSSSPHTMAV